MASGEHMAGPGHYRSTALPSKARQGALLTYADAHGGWGFNTPEGEVKGMHMRLCALTCGLRALSSQTWLPLSTPTQEMERACLAGSKRDTSKHLLVAAGAYKKG